MSSGEAALFGTKGPPTRFHLLKIHLLPMPTYQSLQHTTPRDICLNCIQIAANGVFEICMEKVVQTPKVWPENRGSGREEKGRPLEESEHLDANKLSSCSWREWSHWGEVEAGTEKRELNQS